MRPIKSLGLSLTTGLSLFAAASLAGEADVIAVDVLKQGNETYQVSVTVRHADTGWEHYADKWDVIGPHGTLLGTRTLHHPHVSEQPFTRSLTVKIPKGLRTITVRAHDSVDGYGGKELQAVVPQ